MASTQVQRRITITPVGLAYLDGALGFTEVMATQALRFQFPNGHNLRKPPEIIGTPFDAAANLPLVQEMAGMRVRPAVLVWQVLRILGVGPAEQFISFEELQRYLIRCSTHADAGACATAIMQGRLGGPSLERVGDAEDRRMLQEWVKVLLHTGLFVGASADNEMMLSPSALAMEWATDLDSLSEELSDPAGFWAPADLSPDDRLSWYSYFGSIETRPTFESLVHIAALPVQEEFIGGRESDQLGDIDVGQIAQLNLRPFDPANYGSAGTGDPAGRIENVFSAELLARANRLHDALVVLIGTTAAAKGAIVADDPNSVDLLITFKGVEFIVEAKTVAGRSFVVRLRSAIGQILHYDYLRSQQVQGARRKVVAIAAKLPNDAWCVPFLNDFLGFDVLSLDGDRLKVDSNNELAIELFGVLP
jgi:hypothetical protein